MSVLEQLNSLPFTIFGIAKFHKKNGVDVIVIEDCGEYKPICLECGVGYIRENGIINFSKEDDSCNPMYKTNTQYSIVIATNKYTIDSVKNKVLSVLDSDTTIVRIVTDRTTILQSERMKDLDLNLLKIEVEISEYFYKNCTDVELECIC